jgi:hypothetical protein
MRPNPPNLTYTLTDQESRKWAWQLPRQSPMHQYPVAHTTANGLTTEPVAMRLAATMFNNSPTYESCILYVDSQSSLKALNKPEDS